MLKAVKIQKIVELSNSIDGIAVPYVTDAVRTLLFLNGEFFTALYKKSNSELNCILKSVYQAKESQLFFKTHEAETDFPFWVKQAYWTLEEGVLLILGKEPKSTHLDILKDYCEKQDYYAEKESFFEQFKTIIQTAKRYITSGVLKLENSPLDFLGWAKKMQYNVSSLLLMEMDKGNGISTIHPSNSELTEHMPDDEKTDIKISFNDCFPRYPVIRNASTEVIGQVALDFVKTNNRCPGILELWNAVRNSTIKDFSVISGNREIIIEDKKISYQSFSRRIKRWKTKK